MIKDAIKDAEEACEDTGKKNECAAAWDEVEELSAADSHKREGVRAPQPSCHGRPALLAHRGARLIDCVHSSMPFLRDDAVRV